MSHGLRGNRHDDDSGYHWSESIRGFPSCLATVRSSVASLRLLNRFSEAARVQQEKPVDAQEQLRPISSARGRWALAAVGGE